MDEISPIKQHQRRLTSLRQERATWDDQWREICDYIAPSCGRFLPSDVNTGVKRNSKIINNTAGKSRRVLAAGMQAGITSPARPWFRLTTPDPDLAEFGAVRTWLHLVEERIRTSFLKSNIYECLYRLYLQLPFGTATMVVEPSVKDRLRATILPIGQYCLAQDDEARVTTIYREMQKTVEQLVRRYGLANCSSAVQALYQKGALDTWIPVVHAITPNAGRNLERADYRGMPFSSCWFEASGSEKYLRESGYEEFPAMVARWELDGEDIYGRGPGHEALGDTKALQVYEKRSAQLVDKMTTPPMKGPPSLRRGSLLPGDYTPVPGGSQGQSYEPAMVVQPASVEVTQAKIQACEQRIKAEFYADLWLMLSQEAEGDLTATEVMERHEEKMLQLGPVLTRLERDAYNPLIDRAYGILDRAGDLPPAPPELNGVALKIEYISIMAEAQKLASTRSIERFVGFTTKLALDTQDEDILDNLNKDEVVQKYGDYLNVPPELLNSEEKRQQLRKARSQQAAQEQAQEQAVQMSQAAKNLGGAEVSDDNALGQVLNTIPGAAAAAVQSPGVASGQ
jgi:hypothetical protein